MSIDTQENLVSDVLSQSAVTRFIYREARLMDERRLTDWLSLWTEDARYWAPVDEGDFDPHQVHLILDDRERLGERVFRLTHADAHAQEPHSRITHVITGVEVEEPRGNEVDVHAAFTIVEVRRSEQEIYAGRVRYVVRAEGSVLKLAEKKLSLTRSDTALGNLTFLL